MKNLVVSCLLMLSLLLTAACSNLILYEDSPEPVDSFDGTGMAQEPPALTIMVEEKTIVRAPANYGWCYSESPGEQVCVETESLPPNELANMEFGDIVTSQDATIELSFEQEPDSYIVNVWDTQNELIESFDDIRMVTDTGLYIYEINADWEQGEASYFFSVNIAD